MPRRPRSGSAISRQSDKNKIEIDHHTVYTTRYGTILGSVLQQDFVCSHIDRYLVQTANDAIRERARLDNLIIVITLCVCWKHGTERAHPGESLLAPPSRGPPIHHGGYTRIHIKTTVCHLRNGQLIIRFRLTRL